MKIQFKSIAACCLLLMANTSLYAANETANEARSALNSVSIINNTDKDVVYRMLSSSPANIYYGVKHGKSAKYHSKPGDRRATFEVGVCKHYNDLTGLCISFDSSTLKNCVGNAYYDANKVDSITINSLASCTVKCNDGGISSCLVE